MPSSSLGLFCWHVNYDRGDNLPHDQIRCHVTEAKINTVLIMNILDTGHRIRALELIPSWYSWNIVESGIKHHNPRTYTCEKDIY